MTRGSGTTIVIHAGLGKTGSSSIQRWIETNAEVLRGNGVVPVQVRFTDDPGGFVIRRYKSGRLNCSPIIRLFNDPAHKAAAAAQFVIELDRLARKFGQILVSGESLSEPFWRADRPVLAQLNELGARHHVRVAYYIRPQHSSLEAGWRQWGFRTASSPSGYMRSRTGLMHYTQTIATAQVETPNLDFEVRPFRRDLLINNDVVSDFARVFLDMDVTLDDDKTAENVGLPLPLINLLAAFPSLWNGPHDNQLLGFLRDAFSATDVRDERVELGRKVLQKWAHDVFRVENDELLEQTGWPADDWIPDVDGVSPELERLDELWAPPSLSDAELALIERLLTSFRDTSRDLIATRRALAKARRLARAGDASHVGVR